MGIDSRTPKDIGCSEGSQGGVPGLFITATKVFFFLSLSIRPLSPPLFGKRPHPLQHPYDEATTWGLSNVKSAHNMSVSRKGGVKN